MLRYLFFLILLILAISATSGRKIKQIYFNSKAKEFQIIEKYLHRIRHGYFVELGGFNPVQKSTTLKLQDWRGLIVQANQYRANNIRDYQFDDVVVLNYNIATLNQNQKNNDQQTTSKKTAKSKKKIKSSSKVMSISLADLCHKYYKTKPNFMSTDLQRASQMVLKSNDWKNDKCLPDIIYAKIRSSRKKKSKQQRKKTLEDFLKAQKYTMVQRIGQNSLFIHKDKLQFYRKESKINSQTLKNFKLFNWDTFSWKVISKILGKHCSPHVRVRQANHFVYVKQPDLIDIEQINRYSNLVSHNGLNRPIFILQFDQMVSRIKLPGQKYTISTIKASEHMFKKIQTATADRKQLLIYIFDQQRYADLTPIFINPRLDQGNLAINVINGIEQIQKPHVKSGKGKSGSTIIMLILCVLVVIVALLKIYKIVDSNDIKNENKDINQSQSLNQTNIRLQNEQKI